MTKRRERSRFWVVTTHVLTTGFAFPFVATFVGGFLAGMMKGEGKTPGAGGFLIFLAIVAAGYLGGTVYSLSWLRKVAVVERPSACTTPSVIVFTVLALGGLVWNACRLPFGLWGIVGLCAYYAVIIVGFAGLTARGFRRMEEAGGAAAASVDTPPAGGS